MIIKHSTLDDLDIILDIYQYARQFMKETGNPNQWKDDRPTKDNIIKDINKKIHYLVIDNGVIIGVFSLLEETEKTYNYIEGNWLNDEKYVTIHKIASNGKSHHLFKEVLDFASKFSSNIRIDTHEDNKVMQHILDKYGFTYCGIIYLENKDKRLAYQKVLH